MQLIYFWYLLNININFFVSTFLVNNDDEDYNSFNFMKNYTFKKNLKRNSKKEIKFILAFEKERMNMSIDLFVENIIQKYNKKFISDQIVFKLENIYFYDNLKELNKSIYDCVGETENVEEFNYDNINHMNSSDNFYRKLVNSNNFPSFKNNCRRSKLKDLPINIIYFLSSSKFNISNYSNKIIINPCKTRYFSDIYSENGLFPEIELSINDWISNLVGYKINLNDNQKVSTNKILRDLKKCEYLNDDENNNWDNNDYSEEDEINNFNSKNDSELDSYHLNRNKIDSKNGYKYFKSELNDYNPTKAKENDNEKEIKVERERKREEKEELPMLKLYRNSINSNKMRNNYSKKKLIEFK